MDIGFVREGSRIDVRGQHDRADLAFRRGPDDVETHGLRPGKRDHRHPWIAHQRRARRGREVTLASRTGIRRIGSWPKRDSTERSIGGWSGRGEASASAAGVVGASASGSVPSESSSPGIMVFLKALPKVMMKPLIGRVWNCPW